MKLVFLGTAAATPTKNRNLPAIGLHLDSGDQILFDAGEDVQRRFRAAKMKSNSPLVIAITHLHGDHVIGLPGLLFSFYLAERSAPITIIGPSGIAGFLTSLKEFIGLRPKFYELTVIEIEAPQFLNQLDSVIKVNGKLHLLWQQLLSNGNLTQMLQKLSFSGEFNKADWQELISTGDLSQEDIELYLDYLNVNYQTRKVRTFPNFLTDSFESYDIIGEKLAPTEPIFQNQSFVLYTQWQLHSRPTLGYKIIETDRNGRFNPERAVELNIPKGVSWKYLQRGDIITLEDGRIINPRVEGIVGPKRPGFSLFYSGDTTFHPQLLGFCEKCDYCILESTYGDDFETLSFEKGHLTSRYAALIAKVSNIKRSLFLTHFSSRYSDISILLDQAKQIFPETILGDDLLEFSFDYDD